MKLKALQKDLSKSLNLSSRFISNKAQLPVLSNVLLKTQKTQLQINATNLETSISVSIGAKIEKEGEITVPAKILAELISNLNSDQITLTGEKETLKIDTDNFKGKISGMNSSDFPKIPNEISKSATNLPDVDFYSSLGKVLFSVSLDDTRPILTGVLMLFHDTSLTLVSSDGFRLSKKTMTLKTKSSSKKIILPKNSLSEVGRIYQESKNPILFEESKDISQALFAIDRTILSTRLIEGDFPDFEKIIPTSANIKILLDKNEFLRAVKLSSVFAKDASNTIKLKVGEGSIQIISESQKLGQEETMLDAKVEGNELEISFNYRFIEEFLNIVEGDNVEIELIDAASPGVFKDTKDKNYLHLIMPIKS